MTLEIRDMITPGNENAFTVGDKKADARLSDLPPVHLALLEDDLKAVACLATTNANGRPQLTPVWLNHDGSRINLNSARGRLKDRNLRARPVASIMLINPNNPYHFMTIDGVVEEIIDEDDPENGHLATENIDAMAQKYLGTSPYPLRAPKGEVRVLYKVRPTKILTFGPVEG